MKLRERMDSIALELLRVTEALTNPHVQVLLPPETTDKIRQSRQALTELGYAIQPPPRFTLNQVVKSCIRQNLNKQGELNISGALGLAHTWTVENWSTGQPACEQIRRKTKAKWANEAVVYEYLEREILEYLAIDLRE